VKRMKQIGLAAIAVLALTAIVGVASASAAHLEAEAYSTTVKSSSPYGLQEWHFASSQQGCDAPAVQGAISGANQKVLNTTVSNSKCYWNFSAAPNLEMNGCSFVYRLGAKTGATTFNGAIDIACPAGKTVAFTGGSLSCKVNVPAQKNLSATFENVGSGKARSVKATVNATGLQHTQVEGHDCGGVLGSFSNGTWTGSWKLEGSFGGSAAAIWVAPDDGYELPPAGIGIGGSPLKLNGGTYPMSISGSQGTQHVITLGGKTVKCTTANLSTSISSATAQFAVTGEYSGCTVLGYPGEVKMNGCTYTFSVINQPPYESSYAGHADISCPAGKSIEIKAISAGLVKCTVTIGSQITNDTGYLVYTNEASTSTIGLELKITGIDYHQQEGSGLGKCTTGDFTDGTYTGTSTLVGSY
jgi:hypothetical protein